MFSLPIVVVVMVLKATKRSHYVRVERESIRQRPLR